MKNSSYLKLVLLASLGILIACNPSKENPDFPVRELNSQNNSPFIFYVSGDAGFNTFSKNLSNELFKRNYDITALDSKTYFWKPKTPEETTKKISNYLTEKLKGRKNQKIVLLGYSFGADISAFIVNRLDKNLQQKIVSVILLDPSKTADFEVSLQGMIFDKVRGDYEVLPEVNKMQVPKTMFLLSNIGIKFPYQKVTIANFTIHHLPGNHRFNYEYRKLANLISQNINS